MTQDVTSGCKCGLIRYQGAFLDAMMFRCHCRDCQRLSGSGHADTVSLARDWFCMSGASQAAEMTGGTRQSTYSSFCPSCGSQLTSRSDGMGDRIYVYAASLDDPSLYQPERSLFAESAQDWDFGSVIKT